MSQEKNYREVQKGKEKTLQEKKDKESVSYRKFQPFVNAASPRQSYLHLQLSLALLDLPTPIKKSRDRVVVGPQMA